ncbi:MAG: dihydroorotase [Pseudomonadota bacterium]|nr:dihydroorotase [Pseudomonadota bacterium]
MIKILQPDDWHVHLREGALMDAVAPFTARQFGRAIVMPNLTTPITDAYLAERYRLQIISSLSKHKSIKQFQPLMTAYLCDTTSPEKLSDDYNQGVFFAAKLYPRDATTNSSYGVSDLKKLYPVFRKMQENGMPLLIHGEVTDPKVDIFDREHIFIEQELRPLVKAFPSLRIVLEHITTTEAVKFIRVSSGQIGATITAHHLSINRNAMFEGGLRPHNYCLPIAKREKHRLALCEAAMSGEPWFFLGTDSAPHGRYEKETACGCAGVFTAISALELYAEIFSSEGALDKLEGFASRNGPKFYGLELNTRKMLLVQENWTIPQKIKISDGREVCPFRAGESIGWKAKLEDM